MPGTINGGNPSTYVISITPFGPGGAFDEDGVRRHLRRMGAGGVGVYLGGGGSGEGYVLTADEQRRLLEIGVEELQGTVPVRAMGCEPRTSGEMLAYVRLAAETGVDGAQIYSLDQGHGHRPTPAEIQGYFDDVLSAAELPVVLSTHQSVGYQVPIAMLVGFLERYPHLVGINCTHQDLAYLAGVVDAVGDRAEVHVGGPQQALVAWSLGAAGYLSSEANLAPELCRSLVDAYAAGDGTALTDRFGTLVRLSLACYGAGGIRATKAVLSRLGLPGGDPRRPQLPVAADVVDGLLGLIGEWGIRPVG